MQRADHYLLLDAARGIAAILVLLYHAHIFIFPSYPNPLGPDFLKHSYLAVDLFFLMSGLVIARSYEAKLRSSALTFRQFTIVRLIRLYPLYIVGLLLGVVYAALKPHLQADATFDLGSGMLSLGLNSLFLPALTDSKTIFPFNVAAWSLCFEMAVNLLYALIVRHVTNWQLLLMVLSSAVYLLCMDPSVTSLDLGWGGENLAGGLARIGFSFPLGILMWRHIHWLRFRLPSGAGALLLLPLTWLIATPTGTPTIAYDLACVFVAFPVFVALACASAAPARLVRGYSFLGFLSYPLYILHVPLLWWLAGGINS